MRIGIITVNYNGAAHTLALYESLRTMQCPEGVSWRLAVVDNGSSDGDRERLSRGLAAAENVDLVVQENAGFAGGVNRGFAAHATSGVQPDWWWLLNNDATVAPNCLVELLRSANALGEQAVLGATLVYAGDRQIVQAAGGARYYPPFGRARHNGKGQSIAHVLAAPALRLDYIVGASMFFSAAILRRVGPLPEEYFLYYEELAWCRSARTRGATFHWVPTARVYHVEGATTGATDKFRRLSNLSAYYLWRNSILYTRFHHAAWLPTVFLTKCIELGQALMRGDLEKWGVFCSAMRDAWRGRQGKMP